MGSESSVVIQCISVWPATLSGGGGAFVHHLIGKRHCAQVFDRQVFPTHIVALLGSLLSQLDQSTGLLESGEVMKTWLPGGKHCPQLNLVSWGGAFVDTKH